MIPGGNSRTRVEYEEEEGKKKYFSPIILNDFMKIQLNFLWN